MYEPQFTISNTILSNIGTIEACREVIVNAPIVPAWEKQFVQEAVVRTVHYGTAIEGNALSLDQAREVLEGKEVVARQRDVQEVLNYREVLKYIDRLGERIGVIPDRGGMDRLRPGFGESKEGPFKYDEEQLLKIHALTVERIVDQSHDSGGPGEFRKSQVIVRSVQSGEASYKAPPAIEVPYLVEGLFLWLNNLVSLKVHSVLRAGVVHYFLVAVHPFIEGNGRVARAMATLVLGGEGYDMRKLFSLEEYFDRDVQDYYAALQAVSNQDEDLEKRDLTSWLEYFTQALAVELTKVKDRVRNLSMDDRLKNKVGRQIALSERQIKIVEYLKENDELYMRDAKELVPNVSEDTLLRDMTDLMRKKLVKKRGQTKAARYVLVS